MAIDEEDIRIIRNQLQTLEEKLADLRRHIDNKVEEIKHEIQDNA